MKATLQKAAKSWKTTLAAVLTASASLLTAVVAMLDGNDETEPEWGVTMALVVAAFGLFMARDSDKRSEDVGA